MVLVYIINNQLLTYKFNCSTHEYECIVDDIAGKNSEEVAQEIALSRRSMV
jgi:hypothetical protein